MSLEISEIGIRMRVRGADDEPAREANPGGDSQGCRDLDREQIVQDCLRRVLAVLRNVEER